MVRRVLFDLDGTLFDTQQYHATTESLLLSRVGVSLQPDELTQRFAGWQTKKIFETLGCDSETAQTLVAEKWNMLNEYAPEARQKSDLRTLFNDLIKRDISFSIGTSSPVSWAKELLERHDLLSFFDDASIVGRDMVAIGKPHPEVWLKAAGNIAPEDCLVIEDGIAGVEAARAAEMSACLLLPATHAEAHSIRALEDIFDYL